MFGFARKKPVAAAVKRSVVRPRAFARDFIVSLSAFCCCIAAIGFFSAGAYTLLSDIYSPAAALFMVGGFYAAVAAILVLYLVLGGHEVARAAYAANAPDEQNVLEGLAPAVVDKDGVNSGARSSRNRIKTVPVVVLGVLLASYTAMKRLTR